MRKSDAATLAAHAPHPRFPVRPFHAERGAEDDVLRGAFWRHRRETLFPRSQIPADAARQNCALYPRRVYVDENSKCHDRGQVLHRCKT